MNNKQIESFISVVESGSFSAAARKEYISPQAMLQQINSLEREVGVQLLIRSNKGIKLTAAGEKYYEGILEINQKMCALLEEIRTEELTKQEVLRLGIYLTEPMNAMCADFLNDYPNISLEYMILANEAGLDNFKLLSDNTLDVLEQAEVPDVYQSGFEYTNLFKSRCFCALSPSHPLASRASLSPSDLSGMQVAIHSEACVPGLKSLLQREAPNSTLVNRTRGVKSAFDHCIGNGVFIIAESFAEKHKPLRIIPLESDVRWSFGIIYKKNPNPLVRLFVDYAKSYFIKKEYE